MEELFDIKVSAKDTLISIGKSLYKILSEYNLLNRHNKKVAPILTVKKVISMLEDYVKSGNTKYIGRAVVVIYFGEPADQYSLVDKLTVEIVWSRVDLRTLFEALKVLSSGQSTNFYEMASKSKKYRFFCGARIVSAEFAGRNKTFLKEVNGLSEDGVALWSLVRSAEIYHFGERYELCVTLRLARSDYAKFYKEVIGMMNFLKKFTFSGFYPVWRLNHIYNKVDVLEVNGSIPAALCVSKSNPLILYLISPKKVVRFIFKNQIEYKKLFYSFKSWSKEFLFKKLLPALIVSGKAEVLENTSYIE